MRMEPKRASHFRSIPSRHKAHRVGTATSSAKGGFVLYIPAGISLTGRGMMVPEKTPLNEIDLREAYHSGSPLFHVGSLRSSLPAIK